MESTKFFINRFGNLVEQLAPGEKVICDGVRVLPVDELFGKEVYKSDMSWFYGFSRVTNYYKA